MIRTFRSLATAACLTMTLAACVGSETPLLPDAEAIADSTLAGSWSYRDGSKTERLVATLEGRTFLVTNPDEPAKKPVIATLHPFDTNRLILQMRNSERRAVQYMLVSKDSSRPGRTWLMQADLCNRKIAEEAGFRTLKSNTFSCTVTTRAQLMTLLQHAARVGAAPDKLMPVTQDTAP